MEIGQRLAQGERQHPMGTAGQANSGSAPINELDLRLEVAEVLAAGPPPASLSLSCATVRSSGS